MAAVAAVIGALGLLSGVGGLQIGTRVTSRSTLSPIQRLWMAQNMSQLSNRMPGYFSQLGKLGEEPQNPASALPNAATSFYGNVQLPFQKQQQQYGKILGQDPAHQRINDLLNQKMQGQSQLAMGALKADFMNRSRVQ